jgi:hypothetical protein
MSQNERRQIEEERLARLSQKRKYLDTEADVCSRQRLKLPPSFPTLTHSHGKGNEYNGNHLRPQVRFPDGVVKRTWAYGAPRSPDDIKIEEVLQKEDLEIAVFSAFQIDVDWITSKLNPGTKVIWVLQAKTDAEVSYNEIYLPLRKLTILRTEKQLAFPCAIKL